MQSDVLIVGCGAAGLQAAIHAARKKVKVIVTGKPEGSALWKAHIDNYFGIPTIEGKELLRIGLEQAKQLGVEIFHEEVISLEQFPEGFRIRTEGMKEFDGKALILATGISRQKLNVPGEKEFYGLGVSYCANCDCHFFKKKKVAVIGNGSNAAVAALLLKEYAIQVFWVAKERNAFPELIAKAKGAGVELVDDWPTKVVGEKVVTGIGLMSGKALEVDGVFIELGAKGAADMALEVGIVADEKGLLPVDKDCRTEVDGVFACGDITGQPWQVARAVGEGCIAGLRAAEYVRKEKVDE